MRNNRSEYTANRDLAYQATQMGFTAQKPRPKYGHQPRPWPKAARPTWGTMEATGKPLWAFLLGRKS